MLLIGAIVVTNSRASSFAAFYVSSLPSRMAYALRSRVVVLVHMFGRTDLPGGIIGKTRGEVLLGKQEGTSNHMCSIS